MTVKNRKANGEVRRIEDGPLAGKPAAEAAADKVKADIAEATKARKKASWTITEAGVLGVVHPKGFSGQFDMTALYPDWATLTQAQRHVMQYGAKQLLSDSLAGETKPTWEMLEETWNDILAGKVGHRTGVTSLKKQLAAAAEASPELKELLAKAGINL